MTKEQLNQKEQHYASSLKEAEEIIVSAKENVYLTKQQISEKHNKFGTYFLVDLTYSFNVPREIMENEANKNEGEGSGHEGVKVTNNGDGTFEVDPNQTSIDEFVENEIDELKVEVPF